jgi:hypothetical protein
VTTWIIIGLAGLVGVSFALVQFRRAQRGHLAVDLGEVSQSWLMDQRNNKQDRS